MKKISTILIAAAAMFGSEAMAQLDLNDPKFAVWGETVEERQSNLGASNYLKEALDSKDYVSATGYLQQLLNNCPSAQQQTFARGVTLYKNKAARAKSLAEKNMYIDSIMQIGRAHV